MSGIDKVSSSTEKGNLQKAPSPEDIFVEGMDKVVMGGGDALMEGMDKIMDSKIVESVAVPLIKGGLVAHKRFLGFLSLCGINGIDFSINERMQEALPSDNKKEK